MKINMKINLITLALCGIFMMLMITALWKVRAEVSEVRQELKNQSRYKKVIVTGYPPLPEHTNEDSFTTASGHKVRLGGVAVCPSMQKQGWAFFRKIYLKGCGKYDGIHTILDLMNPLQKEKVNGKIKKVPCKNRVDLFRWTYDEAVKIYCENAEVVLLGDPS